MAKRRYRFDAGGGATEQIKGLIGSFSPYNDELLNAIESGDINKFNALMDDPGLGGRFDGRAKDILRNEFNQIQSQLPSKKSAIKKYLDSVKDNSNLSEQQIGEKIQGLRDFQGQNRQGFDSQGLRNKITEVFKKHNLPPSPNSGKNPWDDPTVIDSLINRFYDDPNFDVNVLPQYQRDSAREVQREIQNYLPESFDPTEDIGRLTGLQGNIQDKRSRQGALDKVLSDLPEQLSSETERLIGGEVDRASKTLEEELTPEVMQGLNVRGLLYGGDLEAELTRGAENVYGGIEGQYQDLLGQDDQFYRDMAFRATLQKASETEGDYLSGLERQRTSALNESQNRFKTSQANLQTKFEQDLFKRQQDRQLASYAQKARNQKSMQESQGRTQLLSNVLTPLTQITTAKIAYENSGGITTGTGGK